MGSPTSFAKRIAVCVSGEFRHVHHRVPEQQIRQLVAFLAGVDCDLFLHGWHNSSEALMLSELRPRAYLFEPRPSFGHLAEEIRYVEPNIKAGRDEGSLAMFHSLEQCFKLVEPFADDYSHVLRIRPDLFVDYSFMEILEEIDRVGVLPDTIYFPHLFHSKGINDQIAFGPIDRMRTYFSTLSHVRENLDREFFNPETALLRNLIAHDVPVAFANVPYALMRERPIRINTAHERFHAQFGTWWSRTEWLPQHQDLSDYFGQKLRAVDDLLSGRVPAVLYSRVPMAGDVSARAIVHTRAIDADPAVASCCFVNTSDAWTSHPYLIGSSGISVGDPLAAARQTFLIRSPDGLVISEWRMADGVLHNAMLTVAEHDVTTTPPAFADPAHFA